MGPAFRPQPPRCRVVGPAGLLLVVELTQAVVLPIVVDITFPLSSILGPAHSDEDRSRLRGVVTAPLPALHLTALERAEAILAADRGLGAARDLAGSTDGVRRGPGSGSSGRGRGAKARGLALSEADEQADRVLVRVRRARMGRGVHVLVRDGLRMGEVSLKPRTAPQEAPRSWHCVKVRPGKPRHGWLSPAGHEKTRGQALQRIILGRRESNSLNDFVEASLGEERS